MRLQTLHSPKPGSRFTPGPLFQDPQQLEDSGNGWEDVYRLEHARLVFADHHLLQHDFPQLRDQALINAHPHLARLDDQARQTAIGALLDQWLLDHAAFMSEVQKSNWVVNQPIQVHPDPVRAYRPRRYGRALVISLAHLPGGRQPGLLDVKGVGRAPGTTPSWRSHSSGLCPLGDIFHEVVMQWILEEIFERAAPQFSTVPVYGVIAAGFEGYHPKNPPYPAGIMVRRAHRRPPNAIELPRAGSDLEMVKFEIEMLLRHYGITSSNRVTQIRISREKGQIKVSYGGTPIKCSPVARRKFAHILGLRRECLFDGNNVQLTREAGFRPSHAQLVDFGHYSVAADFDKPLASLVYDRVAHFGAAVMPESPHFVRPNPRFALPYKVWKTRIDNEVDELAAEFAAGHKTGPQIYAALQAMVAEAKQPW